MESIRLPPKSSGQPPARPVNVNVKTTAVDACSIYQTMNVVQGQRFHSTARTQLEPHSSCCLYACSPANRSRTWYHSREVDTGGTPAHLETGGARWHTLSGAWSATRTKHGDIPAGAAVSLSSPSANYAAPRCAVLHIVNWLWLAATAPKSIRACQSRLPRGRVQLAVTDLPPKAWSQTPATFPFT